MTMMIPGVLLVLLVLAALQDVRHFRIANALTLGGAVLGAGLSVILPEGQGLAWSLAGWLVGLLILMPLYALGAMGAGDVKLLAMAGAFTGPAGAALIGLYTLIAGGVLALVVAVGGGRLQQALRNVQVMTVSCLMPSAVSAQAAPASAGRLPYGVAILAGSLAWWWQAGA